MSSRGGAGAPACDGRRRSAQSPRRMDRQRRRWRQGQDPARADRPESHIGDRRGSQQRTGAPRARSGGPGCDPRLPAAGRVGAEQGGGGQAQTVFCGPAPFRHRVIVNPRTDTTATNETTTTNETTSTTPPRRRAPQTTGPDDRHDRHVDQLAEPDERVAAGPRRRQAAADPAGVPQRRTTCRPAPAGSTRISTSTPVTAPTPSMTGTGLPGFAGVRCDHQTALVDGLEGARPGSLSADRPSCRSSAGRRCLRSTSCCRCRRGSDRRSSSP